MTGKTWFKIRLGFMVFAFAASLVTPTQQFDELKKAPTWMVWVMGVTMAFAVLATPLLLQLIFAIQAVNPLSDKIWTRPTHESNPFHIRNPLLFFHFGAYVAGACSLGMLLSALWNGMPALLLSVGVMAGGFSVLLGVHLAMRLFKSKMAATT